MSETRELALNLRDFGQAAYQGLSLLQDQIKERVGVADGGGTAIISPLNWSMLMRMPESGIAVRVTAKLTAVEDLIDISWMCFKAYTYALYTDCHDGFRHEIAVPDGRRRLIGVGSEITRSAFVGGGHLIVTVAVEEIDVPNPLNVEATE